MCRSSQDTSIDHITPEHAAKIVKKFVLPMFDTSKSHHGEKPGIVQAGVTLTGQLSDQLDAKKEEIGKLIEQVEQEAATRVSLQRELNETKQKYIT